MFSVKPRRLVVLGALFALAVLLVVLLLTVLRVQNRAATITQPRADWIECKDHITSDGKGDEKPFCFSSKLIKCVGTPDHVTMYVHDPCLNVGCDPATNKCNASAPVCPADKGYGVCRPGRFCVEPGDIGIPGCYLDYCGKSQPEHTILAGGACYYDDECVAGLGCSTAGNGTCNQGVCEEDAPPPPGGNNGGGGGGGGGGSGTTTTTTTTPPPATPGDPRGCNSSSPNDVWACYQKTGSCSGSWACHDSPGSSACPEACGGLSSCSKDKDCESGEMCKDGKCTGNSCKSDSDCSGNKACIDDTCYRRGQTHLACIENACTRVVGKGDHQDGCTSDSASCVTPVTTHLTCGVDNTCRRVEGSGTSTCLSEGSVCVQRATYLTCRNSTCTRVIGTGTSTCVSENSACGTPTATHLTCGTDKTCKRVAGSGTSTCSSEGSPCGGVSECWGNEGVDGQCYDVNGDSVINILDFSCVSNLWLADITPTSSPKCGGR